MEYQHSRLPPLHTSPNSNSGCYPCANKCHLCKHYLVPGNTAKSHHNNRSFTIRQYVDCSVLNVIYLVNDNLCKLSNVGCTTNSMKDRWSTHKSHIKKGIRSCELASHVIDHPQQHVLDKASCVKYDKSLAKGLSVQILEWVKVEPEDDLTTRLKKCKVREGWWQKQMCTMEATGGLNKRDSQKESTDRSK